MKKFVSLLIVLLSVVVVRSVRATDIPYFYLSPTSGTNYKLYCDNEFKLYVSGGNQKYNAFEAYIKFDTGSINIWTGVINNVFSSSPKFEYSFDMQHVGGSMPGGYKTGVNELVKFTFRTTRNIFDTSFEIVDKMGQNNYGLETTADALSLNGFDVGSKDILNGVENTTYKFYAYPCIIDVDNPTIGNLNKKGTTTSVSGQIYIPINQEITFLTYDRNSNRKVTHWFSGNDTSVLNNYVPVPSINNVDNQEGVNSGTISVKVSCPTCSHGRTNVNADLNISNWNGDSTKNALTWDSERRGYNVSFPAPFDYEVEKKVTVNVSVTDNPNEKNATHTATKTISFNAPQKPNIYMIEPANSGFVAPRNDELFVFYFTDEWAGVDTGSIWIEIKELTGEDDEIIMTGHIYSGVDFVSVVLSGGAQGLGNSGKYEVSFYPKWPLPTMQDIDIEAYVKDLAGSDRNKTFKISTRPDCAFYGCKDPTKVVWPDTSFWMYTGSLLIVSGHKAGSDYPYLQGDTLYCGVETWTGTMLTGNIPLYKDDNLEGYSYRYTGNKLNVTGDSRLNIQYQDGVIIANKQQ